MRTRFISQIKKIPVWFFTHKVFHKKSAFSFARVGVQPTKALEAIRTTYIVTTHPIQPIMGASIAPTRWSQKMGMRVQEEFKCSPVEWVTEKWGVTTEFGFGQSIGQIDWYHYLSWLTGHQKTGFKTSSSLGRMQIPSGVSHPEHQDSVQIQFKSVSTHPRHEYQYSCWTAGK